MDTKTDSGKPSMSSSVTIKYNVNQEEVENISTCDSSINSAETSFSLDETKKLKKNDKGVSIINKYLKAFKIDKEVDQKIDEDVHKDGVGVERKSVDVSNESSGSPIKEYFSKFSKRADSVDSNNDLESIKEKDANLNSDRWKLFSDFKYKIAQAVEDIKSSRSSEGVDVKDNKQSADGMSVTDSEDNSLQMDLDLNSCASTENQVSSITSSLQNLSELSPPIISHSSTMTDMDIETSSSLETNKAQTETADVSFEYNDVKNTDKPKNTKDEGTDVESDQEAEIESGVDALEDIGLLSQEITEHFQMYKTLHENNSLIIGAESHDNSITITSVKGAEKMERTLYDCFIYVFTVAVFCSNVLFPGIDMLNGFLIGVWFMYFLYQSYHLMLGYMFSEKHTIKKTPAFWKKELSNIPHIVEFEPLKKHEGWINVYLSGKYDPLTYHISLTQTAFMKLEGSTLRLSFTHNKVPKHALFNEQPHKVPFYQHRIYNLDEAHIKLLPSGIVKKRHWSKKYPVCITLKDKSKVTIFNAKSSFKEPEESNVSIQSKDDVTTQEIVQEKPVGCVNVEEAPIELTKTPSKPFKMKVKDTLFSKTECGIIEQKTSSVDVKIKETPASAPIDINNSKVANEENFNYVKVQDNENNIQIASETDLLSSSWSKDDLNLKADEPIVLYLFGRTGREKDEWFRRLQAAIEAESLKQSKSNDSGIISESVDKEDDISKSNTQTESKVQMGSVKSDKKAGNNELPSVLYTPEGKSKQSLLAGTFVPKQETDFWRYMKDIMEPSSEGTIKPSRGIMWFNAILGRVIYDTFRNKTWVTMLQERIQKKLNSLKLPNFMGPLVVTALEFSNEAPQFSNAFPTINSQGLWVDLHVSYNGRVTMTLTTKLNLMSLVDKKENVGDTTTDDKEVDKINFETFHAVYHSDLDDTAESSSEDEAVIVQSLPTHLQIDTDAPILPANNQGGSSTKKILKVVDKIAASNLFQYVSEYRYVKRAMEGVSNTDLKLSVELYGLFGCLTINMPPPPSDRMWFGFRGNPQLLLRTKPIVGSRVMNFAVITSWIEKKLCTEFEKLLVLPNMEDIHLDFMIPPNIE